MSHKDKISEYDPKKDYVLDWLSRMYEDFSLVDLFNRYTKSDLIELAKSKGMKKISNCKKAQLIEKIIAHMTDMEEVRRYFLSLHKTELQELQKAMECESVYKTKEPELFLGLLSASYVDIADKNKVIIPKEFREVYDSFGGDVFERERKKWSYIRCCLETIGLLYGIAPNYILPELVYQNKSLHISTEEIFSIAEAIPKEYTDIRMKDELIYLEPFLTDDRGLLNVQGDKPFYIPTKEEIISLGFESCLPNEPSLLNFQKFLRKKFKLDRETAYHGGKGIQQMMIEGYDIDTIFQMLEEIGIWIDNDFEMHVVMQQVMELWRNTRIIVNRGYKPVELF